MKKLFLISFVNWNIIFNRVSSALMVVNRLIKYSVELRNFYESKLETMNLDLILGLG